MSFTVNQNPAVDPDLRARVAVYAQQEGIYIKWEGDTPEVVDLAPNRRSQKKRRERLRKAHRREREEAATEKRDERRRQRRSEKEAPRRIYPTRRNHRR